MLALILALFLKHFKSFAYLHYYLVSSCWDIVHNIGNITDLGHNVYKLPYYCSWSSHSSLASWGARVSQGCMSILCFHIPSRVVFTVGCIYLRSVGVSIINIMCTISIVSAPIAVSLSQLGVLVSVSFIQCRVSGRAATPAA